MKEKFFEYYSLTPDEISAIWKDCMLVLDTNFLLNLYRLTEPTRNDIIGILEKFNEKLWMPFQVGFEYHENREGVIESISLKKLQEQVNKTLEALKNTFRKEHSRNPYISIDAWEKKLDKEIVSFEKFFKSKYKDAPDYIKQDDIRSALCKLYFGRVGDTFTKEDLQRLYTEGKARFSAKIPPGFRDEPEKKGKGERHIYGDFIIWKEVIEKAKKDKRSIVFVSDDRKEDWIRIVHGEKKGPRWELLREFYDETGGQKVVIMNQQQFLDFIHDLPEYSIKSKTLKEIEAIQSTKDSFPLLTDLDIQKWQDFLKYPKYHIDPSIFTQYKKTLDQLDLGRFHSLLDKADDVAGFPSFISYFQEQQDNPGGEESDREGEDMTASNETEDESQ